MSALTPINALFREALDHALVCPRLVSLSCRAHHFFVPHASTLSTFDLA